MALSTDLVPDDFVSIDQERRSQPLVSYHSAIQLGSWQNHHDWVTGLPLLAGDAVATFFSVAMLQWLASSFGWIAISSHAIFTFGLIGFTLLVQHIHGLYPACGLPHSLEFRRVLRTCLIVVAGVALGLLMQYPRFSFPFLGFLFLGCVLPLSLTLTRSILRSVLAGCDWWAQPVVIVGDGKEGQQAFDHLCKNRSEGLRPIGIAFTSASQWPESVDGGQYIGPAAQLESILMQGRACRVMLTKATTEPIDFPVYHGIPHVTLATDLGFYPTERTRLHERNGTIELQCYNAVTALGALTAKRALDLTLVLLTAPAWLPLMGLIALAIKLTNPGPIFYKQDRVGRFRKPFRAIKFRSMVCNADQKLKSYLEAHPELRAEWKETHKLQNDPRITRIGSFLRKSSLDELPQLFNVLRGDMSLVGPRPLIEHGEYDQRYIDEHPEVFELYQLVRPGITGLWQISGRNTLPYIQRVALDRYYLQNWSLTLDIFILWKTLKTAVLREGAY